MASDQPDSVQSPEYIALGSFLRGDIKVLGNALNTFCKPVESKCLDQSSVSDADSVESRLWMSWTAVVTKARETHYTSANREKLVDFMLNLAYRPTPFKEGEGCVVSGRTIWRDLPIFGWKLRESWNFDCPTQMVVTKTPGQTHIKECAKKYDDALTKSQNASQNASKNRQWVNLNAWTSTFVAALQAGGIDWLDYTLFGLWSIRSGLEEDKYPSLALVEAAGVWFLYSGSVLWDLCKQNKSYDGKVAAPGSFFKDWAWNGFSVERWNSWEQRLLEVQFLYDSVGSPHRVKEVREIMKAIQVDQEK